MKKILYTIIALILLVFLQGCNNSKVQNTTQSNNHGDSSHIIKTEKYEGTILTIDGENNWIPDNKIIDDFESKIIPYINHFKSKIGNVVYCDEKSLSFVKENIKKYKRQYIGRIVDGKKVLYCNCLLISEYDSSFGDWEKRYIVVKDGGASFFQINYDIESKKLSDFYINGEA